jgi:acyl-CoA-dependent ceramide synthase
MLRYLSLPTDVVFGAFLVSWLFTRQIGFFLVLVSTYRQSTQYIPYGWDPKSGYFWTPTVWATFVGLLGALQVFNCIWFWMVSRVAYRVVKGLSAEDTRSDDEE